LTAPRLHFTLCRAAEPRGHRKAADRAHRPGGAHGTVSKKRKTGMSNSRVEERFDSLVSQVHDWVESAVALDEGHFPSEMLSDLRDLIEELKSFLEDEESTTDYKRGDVLEIFVTPEMAEVMHRFPKVRRLLESAWGSTLTDQIEEEAMGFESDSDDDDD
jgi:hypothetical protein